MTVHSDIEQSPPAPAQADARPAAEPSELQRLAQRHLIMHFTGAATYAEQPPIVIARGHGCWLDDDAGNRYLDALAGLFCVQIGYGFGDEIGEAVREQMRELPYYTNWGYAHPPSIRLAAKVAALAPEGLDRVFFTSGGGESNEAAIKLIRQYQQARGEPSRMKFLARRVSYHGTSYGAMSINGMTNFRKLFEPLVHGARHISNTKRYQRSPEETEEQFTAFLLDELESLIIQEGPDTVAGLFIEPLQNAGGSLVPPAGYCEGVRRICDQYDVVLVADEVISGFGRLGEWFASTRYGLKPDIITFAKGIGSAYVPLGGMITTDAMIDTVLAGPAGMYCHGLTYGGHPAACAAGLANLAIMEREDVIGNVRRNEPYFRSRVRELLELPLVGDARGDGYHYSLELVTDRRRRRWDAPVPATEFVAKRLAPALLDRGILCRAAVDHEGTPLIQFSPPLIMSREEIDTLVERVGAILERLGADLPVGR